jgi:P27 family predicted phage terminase small subunit
LTKRAKNIWNELGEQLVDARLITELDRDSFAHLCQLTADLEALTKQVNREGIVTKGPRGAVKTNPAHIQRMKLLNTVESLRTRFGLDPASRSRIEPVPEGEDTEIQNVWNQFGSLEQAQTLLGHSRIDTTADTYVHVNEVTAKRGLEILAKEISCCPLIAHFSESETGIVH